MHIVLRRLELKDAPFMLEWMQDPEIACFFRFNAAAMTVEDCSSYIRSTWDDEKSRHYAIADEAGEYLGTISLKDIDHLKLEAEYAISTRKKAHGTGAAKHATEALFQIGFEELGLKKIFLNVLTDNQRANNFYRKMGFSFRRTEHDAVEIRGEQKSLNWYDLTADKYWENENA